MVRSLVQRNRSGLAIALILYAAWVAPVPARGAPCIDTVGQARLVRRLMAVRPAGRPEVPVAGEIASLDPATGEFGIKVFGMESEQRIGDAVIRLQTLEPSMEAQQPQPLRTSLGAISAEFPLTVLSVERGVIRYPGCSDAEQGHEIAFTGTLSLGDGRLKVDGSFVDYTPPKGGSGGPGMTGGKRG